MHVWICLCPSVFQSTNTRIHEGSCVHVCVQHTCLIHTFKHTYQVVHPWDTSAMAVFRAVNQEAHSALHLLRARNRCAPHRTRAQGEVGGEDALSEGGGDVVCKLVTWLAEYRTLFSSKCVYCHRILAAESCESGAGA